MFLFLFTCFVFCMGLRPCLILHFTSLIVSKCNHFFFLTDGKHHHTAPARCVYGTFPFEREITWPEVTSLCHLWHHVLRQWVEAKKLQPCGYIRSASTAGKIFWLSGTNCGVFKHSWWSVDSGIGILCECFVPGLLRKQQCVFAICVDRNTCCALQITEELLHCIHL